MKMRKSVVTRTGKTSKWPFAPLPAHEIMSRGELNKRHLADVKAKSGKKTEKKSGKKVGK